MYIRRDQLLNKLVRYREKDIVKVITGIRRCGKSVLLNELFYDYLLSEGVCVLSIRIPQNRKGNSPFTDWEFLIFGKRHTADWPAA